MSKTKSVKDETASQSADRSIDCEVLTPLLHDGKGYQVGEIVALQERYVDIMARVGVVRPVEAARD